jgi:hypothetical protein
MPRSVTLPPFIWSSAPRKRCSLPRVAHNATVPETSAIRRWTTPARPATCYVSHGGYVSQSSRDAEIHRLSAAGIAQITIAEQLDVSRMTVWRVLGGTSGEIKLPPGETKASARARILASQGHKCAICGCDEPSGGWASAAKGWHLDHDHETGMPRGVLCARCNWLVGNAKDDVQILVNAARYLLSWP